MRRLRMVLTY
jgi:hypothetical protein